VLIIERINQEPESSKPCRRKEQVHGPVEEAGREGEKPEQAEEQRDAGDDFDVDEALLGPGVEFVVGVEVGSDYAGDDLRVVSVGSEMSEGRLAAAQTSSLMRRMRERMRERTGILTENAGEDLLCVNMLLLMSMLRVYAVDDVDAERRGRWKGMIER
jgi:hypothetical protein